MSSSKPYRCSARIAAILLFSAALFVPVPNAWSDNIPITYSLVNYPAGQDGWNLSGSIMTDGTIGFLAPTDILSWSFEVGDDNYSVLVTPSNTSQFFFEDLYVPASSLGTLLFLLNSNPAGELYFASDAPPDPSYNTIWPECAILWAWNGSAEPYMHTYMDVYAYEPGPGGDNIYHSDWFDLLPESGIMPSSVVIATATTPEPSTLVLLGIGAISLLAYAWQRQRV